LGDGYDRKGRSFVIRKNWGNQLERVSGTVLGGSSIKRKGRCFEHHHV